MSQELQWTAGFINAAGRYLTAESFQFKVNANGQNMKKKQIWILEKIGDEEIGLKSAVGRYLGCDRDGNVSGDSEEIGPDNTFTLLSHEDGRVAIKNTTHNRYLGGSGDHLSCSDKDIAYWTLQLAMSPQINLRSVNRKTYAHLSDDGREVRVNEEIAWGYDASINLEFYDGKYAIRAANALYVNCKGRLDDSVSKSSLYTLVFRGTRVAFRDYSGSYLTAVGAHATLMSRKDTIGKDELFTFEDTNPQITLIAYNRKYVSVRMGREEVRANQAEITDDEIFQLEAADRNDMSGNVKWLIRSKSGKYWNCGDTLLNSSVDGKDANCQFSIEWMGPMVCLKATNGKYLTVKSNGQLGASSVEAIDSCKFVVELVNHPIITLRGQHGFVGVKGSSSVLECNRSQYDIFRMAANAGTYSFKGANGKYWEMMENNGFALKGDAPTEFFVEIRAHTRMCILSAQNGQYIKGEQNGAFTATGGQTVSASTLWEY